MTRAPQADLDHILEHTRPLWEELRGQRIFITGGTGFFGCWLLESFVWANDRLDLGAEAVVLTRKPDAFQRKAPHLASNAAVRLWPGDVRSFAVPEGPFACVIHAAADVSVKLNAESPLLVFDTIVEGTRRALDFAAERGARKFLLTSSGAVYGRQPAEVSHILEEHAGAPDPTDPNSAYGEGKRAAELLCTLYAGRGGLEPKIARCFTFLGPYLPLDAHFAAGNFIRDALRGGPIQVRGDGAPYRSYLYAADLAIWLWTIFLRGAPGRAYNVGSEEAVTIAELARAVGACVQPPAEVRFATAPASGRMAERYVPCTRRAREELQLRQHYSLAQAIRSTLAAQDGGRSLKETDA
jgi:dTDP-glucose 4,6-dehydratase